MINNEKTVFLPWRSEFGLMLIHFVRFVNDYKSSYKVVCCRKGDEALFPSASEFYYHWEEPKDETKCVSQLKSKENYDYLQQLKIKLSYLYKDYTLIEPPHRTPIDKSKDFTPQPKVKRDLSCDIVVCPRYRKYGEHRNYQYWPQVTTKLRLNGLYVVSAGLEETSVYVDADDYTYNYDTLDATIEFMQNCRLTLATDAGLAHLAVLVGSPLAVIYDKPKIEAGRKSWPWLIDTYMKPYSKNYCEPILYGWNNPDTVVDYVLDYVD